MSANNCAEVERDSLKADVERLRAEVERLRDQVGVIQRSHDLWRRTALEAYDQITRLIDERDAAREALLEAAAMCDTFAGEHGQRPAYTDATAAALRAAKEVLA